MVWKQLHGVIFKLDNIIKIPRKGMKNSLALKFVRVKHRPVYVGMLSVD